MMKKRRKHTQLTEVVIKNPVAKYAHQFNKAKVFEDKTHYKRGAKHKGREPFIMSLPKGIIKGCLLLASFSVSTTQSVAVNFGQPAPLLHP
jgi:hypothetical protein